jgi:type IV pilus assembly protein PilM
MFGKKKSKPLVGLDIGSSSVKAIELRKKGDEYELVAIGQEPLGQDVVVDGDIMDVSSVKDAIDSTFKQNAIKTKDVATSVSGHSVIVKRITINAASEAELHNAVEYEAPQYLTGLDISEVYHDYHVLGPGASGGFDVMLVAVKQDKVLRYRNAITTAQMNPVVVDIDAFALQNAFEANYEPSSDQMTALLNIGASIMNINIVRGGVPLFTRDVSVGGNQYTDTLQKELDLSFEDAEKLKMGQEFANVSAEVKASHIRSVSDILLLEIQKTFDFFRQTATGENIQRIYVAGGTARIEGLVDLLKQEFNIPVEILDPFRRIAVPKNVDPEMVRDLGPRMTVAVGLALRSFDES